MTATGTTATTPPEPRAPARPVTARDRFLGHVRIMRIDHWFKNTFMLPGVVAALSVDRHIDVGATAWRIAAAVLSICLVASSNYVINELQDAPSDLHHPTKHTRPVPSGLVNVRLAYVQWIVLMLVGIAIAVPIGGRFAVTAAALWCMGCLYNLRPFRTKDVPYLDVLSEAVNNPLRMMAGWFAVIASPFPPLSLLVSYWMVGCYLMAIKRFAEYRNIGSPRRAAQYRRSFAHYNLQRLSVSIMFYASAAMLFFGAFIIRYRLELILSFPLVALAMALYLGLAFRNPSPAEHPEYLYRERTLMLAVGAAAVVMTVFFFVDLPFLHDVFAPTIHIR